MDQSPPPPAAAGQLAELERLFQAHHGAVMRAAYRITGNATDAEDVLQTVFMRLLSRRVDSAAMENVPAYLHRAALNAAHRELAHTAKALLKDLAAISQEMAQMVVAKGEDGASLPGWLLVEIVRDLPRLVERKDDA